MLRATLWRRGSEGELLSEGAGAAGLQELPSTIIAGRERRQQRNRAGVRERRAGRAFPAGFSVDAVFLYATAQGINVDTQAASRFDLLSISALKLCLRSVMSATMPKICLGVPSC